MYIYMLYYFILHQTTQRVRVVFDLLFDCCYSYMLGLPHGAKSRWRNSSTFAVYTRGL